MLVPGGAWPKEPATSTGLEPFNVAMKPGFTDRSVCTSVGYSVMSVICPGRASLRPSAPEVPFR